MTTPTTPQGTAAAGIPVFGSTVAPKYDTFGLTVFRRDATHYTETFQAVEVDGGGLMQMMNAPNEQAMVRALGAALYKTLRDDDGVPVDYAPPADPELDPENEDEWLRDEVPDDAPEGTEGALLYRRWDGELTDDPAELIPSHDEGSSLRRFTYLMASRDLRIPLDGLLGLAEHLVTKAAGRPTKRPRSSGSGQRPTGPGSGARRR